MKNKELKKTIMKDKRKYSSNKNIIEKLYYIISSQNSYNIYKQIKAARNYKYYSKNKNNIVNKILFLYYSRKNNKLGRKNIMELHGSFGKNIKIYHQGVIITKNSVLGDNCILHGMNCIGIKDNDLLKAPQIGNNVEIGYGAMVIGDIIIANNIKIGANAVVTKSFLEEGITIAGIPARKV